MFVGRGDLGGRSEAGEAGEAGEGRGEKRGVGFVSWIGSGIRSYARREDLMKELGEMREDEMR